MKVKQVVVLLLFYTFEYLLPGTKGGTQQRWLKVITKDGEEFSVTSKQCIGGIWAPKPIHASCICVNGMWAISKNFCDDDFEILTGESHCFTVNRKIRKFSYIGTYWNQPNWFGNYIFRSDMPYVARFNGEDAELFLRDSLSYVLRANQSSPPLTLSASRTGDEQDEICFSRNHRRNSTLLEIYALDGRNIFELRKSYKCNNENGTKPIVSMKPGQSWRPKKSHEIRESTSIYPNCKPSKVISTLTTINNKQTIKRGAVDYYNRARQRPRSNLKGRNMPFVQQYQQNGPLRNPVNRRTEVQMSLSTTTCRSKSKSRQATVRTTFKPYQPKTTTRWKTTTKTTRITTSKKPPALQWTPIKSKERRMKLPRKEKVSGLDSEDADSDPYWDNPAYSAQEKDQLIFEQTGRLLRMHIGFLTHGTKYMGINKEEFTYLRIAKNILLKTCPEVAVPKPLLNAVVRLFRYALYESIQVFPYSEFTDKEEDSRISNSLVACYDSASRIEFKSCNSKGIDSVVHDGEEYNATLPAEYSDSNSLDFVLETIWKVMTHSHYYCAKDFAQNPADLSNLMMKWEAFFSPILRYRWANAVMSWELFRKMFHQEDLEPFIIGMNRCVGAAYSLSHYPAWIQRPALSRSSKGSRRKRSVIKSPDQWKNQGYCVEKFFDPVRHFGAQASPRCLREYNGRHDL